MFLLLLSPSRYTLSNGVTRYEKSYWKPVGQNNKILARKGFYSHPLTNGKYLTVFYTADENGYLQDTGKLEHELKKSEQKCNEYEE